MERARVMFGDDIGVLPLNILLLGTHRSKDTVGLLRSVAKRLAIG